MKILALAALAALFAFPVMAQPNCAPRDIVVERLAEKFGETRQSLGIGAQGAVVEVFASDETGSWTITVTNPHGLTCLVASGQSFEATSESLPQGEDM
jgi:hypothetical protein